MIWGSANPHAWTENCLCYQESEVTVQEGLLLLGAVLTFIHTICFQKIDKLAFENK